jgi:hypothetical protein
MLLLSGLSRDFLSVLTKVPSTESSRALCPTSDWPLIDQNIKVDRAVDMREQAKKIKARTLSNSGKYEHIVPSSYTQDLADFIHCNEGRDPFRTLVFSRKPSRSSLNDVDISDEHRAAILG